MCEMIKIGDRLLDTGGKKYGTVEKINSTGVYVNFGYYNRFFDCDDLRNRELQHTVEFTKNGTTGKSHPCESKVDKEVKFLTEQGWTCKVYQEEVMKNG
jgi:hypothetical protein